MARKTGLGRGLDALIPGNEKPVYGGVHTIPVDRILPNPRQPRSPLVAKDLAELAASIKVHGVLQPLIVTYDDQADYYILIAGERRWQAARQAGLDRVPAIVRDANEQQRLELALIENVQRSDLTSLEQAEAYRQLSDEFGLTHDEIAERVAKSREAITNTLRLLKLSPEGRKALAEQRITEGHARALLGLATPQAQEAALKTVLERGLNVRQTEELVRLMSGGGTGVPSLTLSPRPAPAPELTALEDRLRTRLGTRVQLKRRGKGGSMTIHFYSEEELTSLVDMILGDQS
jgi:ParB family chromosome partitioning protein